MSKDDEYDYLFKGMCVVWIRVLMLEFESDVLGDKKTKINVRLLCVCCMDVNACFVCIFCRLLVRVRVRVSMWCGFIDACVCVNICIFVDEDVDGTMYAYVDAYICVRHYVSYVRKCTCFCTFV